VFSTILVLIIILSGTLATACNRESEPPIPLNKSGYGHLFFFNARIVVDGEVVVTSTQGSYLSEVIFRVSPALTQFDPSYTELIFVHSAEEAYGFPDSTIVAWPSEITSYFLPGLNEAVKRNEADIAELPRAGWHHFYRDVICLEDFGLSYPLTIEDFVDNWEGVYRLWRRLMLREQHEIIRAVGDEDYRRWNERRAERKNEEYDEA